jgi:hypothetical protein|tara:strand:- start:562 stop:906 length:345 start_codon:yes stop_codon:yes gene_type:complete
MPIVAGKCNYLQKGQASLIHAHSIDLDGSLVIGIFIGKQIRDKFNFADVWRHFVVNIAREKSIYCVIYDGAVDTHAFRNQMEYHSTIDGLKVYKINNFIVDNPAAYPNIVTEVV